MFMKSIPLVLLMVLGPSAFARKFSFQTEDVAAFFKATGALSNVQQKAFADSVSSSTLSFSDEQPQVNFGGELGFLMKMNDTFNLRLSAEILQSKVSDVKGSDPGSGTEYLTLTSDVFVFNPTATIEYVYSGSATSRFIAYAGIGYASVRLDNEFDINATGAGALSVNSYTEKSDGSFINGHMGIGWEGLFVDNVTAMVDLGYRFMDINKLKYTSDETVIGGSVTKGSEVQNANGSTRQFDMGGLFLGLSFRFYIDVI